MESDLLSNYRGSSVLVTGGASFIGSHLVERLRELGATVTIVDDFSSGKRSNLPADLDPRSIIELDLSDRVRTFEQFPDCEIVFHLAAVHGGRGFIDTFPEKVLVNMAIDNNVFEASLRRGTRRIVHASSACVYPVGLQKRQESRHLLSEDEAGFESAGSAFPDGAYGWGKIMGEYQLARFCDLGGPSGASARIFTAYGERENESHAAIALIAKALLRVDPFPVWGNGLQTRNFTYVADTVHGLLLLGAERGDGFRAVNVGSGRHHTVLEFLDAVFQILEWRPQEFDLQTWRPVGVASRASDNTRIRSLYGWEPETSIELGVARTVEWYEGCPDRPETASQLEELLLAR